VYPSDQAKCLNGRNSNGEYLAILHMHHSFQLAIFSMYTMYAAFSDPDCEMGRIPYTKDLLTIKALTDNKLAIIKFDLILHFIGFD
jgi:hypothetical protein